MAQNDIVGKDLKQTGNKWLKTKPSGDWERFCVDNNVEKLKNEAPGNRVNHKRGIARDMNRT